MSRAIASVEGVSNVEVSFADKQAVVTSTRCDEGIDADISSSLDKAGYGGKVVERKPPSS